MYNDYDTGTSTSGPEHGIVPLNDFTRPDIIYFQIVQNVSFPRRTVLILLTRSRTSGCDDEKIGRIKSVTSGGRTEKYLYTFRNKRHSDYTMICKARDNIIAASE